MNDVLDATLWRIDLTRSRGELATRHALWGRRAAPLDVVDGSLRADGARIREFSIQLSVGAGQGGRLSFQGQRILQVDHAKWDVAGSFRAGAMFEPATLLVHDLGESADPVHGVRRFVTVRGSLARRWGRQFDGLWHPLIIGRSLDLFCHTEWLSSSGRKQAA